MDWRRRIFEIAAQPKRIVYLNHINMRSLDKYHVNFSAEPYAIIC